MTTIRIVDGAAFSLCHAQQARLRQRRNPTKKSVQSRRISVSGNGTAHPGNKIGIVDHHATASESATGERLESGFLKTGTPTPPGNKNRFDEVAEICSRDFLGPL